MNKLVVGIWMASIVIAFYTGYSTKQPQVKVSENKSHGAAKAPDLSTPQDTYSKEKVNRNRRRISSGQKARIPVQEVMEEMKALLGNNRWNMKAIAKSYNLVNELTKEELLEALELMQADANNPENIAQLRLLLGAYAEYDPMDAISYIENNITTLDGKSSAIQSVLYTWSENNPEETYEWFSKQSRSDMGHTRSIAAYNIFQGLAKQDIESAVEKLKEWNPLDYAASSAAHGIAGTFKEKEEFIDLFENIKELGNQKLKEGILFIWTTQDPKNAAEWLDSQEVSDELKDSVLGNWIKSHPNDATAWYLKKAEDKQKAAKRVAQAWTWRDPQEAMIWAQDQEGYDNQKLIEAVLNQSMYINSDFAIKNINKLENQESRIGMSLKIYMQLKDQNKSKADEYLSASPYKDEINIRLQQK